jgi:hypothetical protein
LPSPPAVRLEVSAPRPPRTAPESSPERACKSVGHIVANDGCMERT